MKYSFSLIIRTAFSFWTRSFLLNRHFFYTGDQKERPGKNLHSRIRILSEFREATEEWNTRIIQRSLNDNKNNV